MYVSVQLVRMVISKLIFIYTLVINLTNVSTVEKDLIKAIVSKLIFVYTLLINLTNVSIVEKNFSNLQARVHIQTGDKPYKFQYFGKKISDNSYLQTHLCIHTGDKPLLISVLWKRI